MAFCVIFKLCFVLQKAKDSLSKKSTKGKKLSFSLFFLRPRRSPERRLRQPLDRVSPPAQIHHGNTRDLAHAPPEVAVARGYDVAAVRFCALAQTVISVSALVVAGQSLESRVLGDPQCDSIPRPELLQLGDDALGDARDALCEEAVHHPLHEVDFVLNGMVNEVCVH